MKIARLTWLLLWIAVAIPGEKKPDIQVLELNAKRSQRELSLDGRVRVTAAKPVRGLLIFFDLLADDGAILTTEKTKVEAEVLPPGAESHIHADTDYLPRAVRVRVRAADFRQRELTTANAGPFAIE